MTPSRKAPADPADTPTLCQLALGLIRRDGDTQPRTAISTFTVQDYAEAMREGANFPPVVVFKDAACDYWLADGFHRYHAALEIGRHDIYAEIRLGELADAQWFSFTANATHGLRRTRADLHQAIERALLHPQGATRSDRDIARHIGCSPTTVGARRAVLEATVQLGQSTERTGADGRTIQTAHIGRAVAPRQVADEAFQPMPDVDADVRAAPGDQDWLDRTDAVAAEATRAPLPAAALRSIADAAAVYPYYAKYRTLVAAHPGRLVFMLHSLWYTAWDEAVEPSLAVLGYRIKEGPNVDQAVRRPSVCIRPQDAEAYFSMLTQRNFSLAVMERDGSVRLFEPDGATEAQVSTTQSEVADPRLTPEAVARRAERAAMRDANRVARAQAAPDAVARLERMDVRLGRLCADLDDVARELRWLDAQLDQDFASLVGQARRTLDTLQRVKRQR